MGFPKVNTVSDHGKPKKERKKHCPHIQMSRAKSGFVGPSSTVALSQQCGMVDPMVAESCQKDTSCSSLSSFGSSSSLTNSKCLNRKALPVFPEDNVHEPISSLSNTIFCRFPLHVQQLLIKGCISSKPSYLSPYRCVLTRHPVHRNSTESDILRLVENIRLNGYIEDHANIAPLVAVRYSKPQTFSTRTAENGAVLYDNWSDHPLLYAIAGAGRGEAIARFFQSNDPIRFVKSESHELVSPSQLTNEASSTTVGFPSTILRPEAATPSFEEGSEHEIYVTKTQCSPQDAQPPGSQGNFSNELRKPICVSDREITQDISVGSHAPRALAFYILNTGENLTAWDVFLLSVALNTADPNSRPFNYFERIDQIAFICLELSKRKQADASCRDIAAEVCSNPFLTELREHLRLDPDHVLQLQNIMDSRHPCEVMEQLIKSRSIFHSLPPNKGILPQNIPQHCVEVLDVMIDMATCVNAKKMKYTNSCTSQTDSKTRAHGQKSQNSRETAVNPRAEGFLHSVAEDQLRYLFTRIVDVESASKFDVLVIRDLVSAVFGAIQECSRKFRDAVGTHRKAETQSLATCPATGAYWIERIVYETSPGGLLSGLWNFPAAALVVLFYIYFVNQIQSFNKEEVETNLLKVGTVLYPCIAELALTIRASKITLVTAPIAVQLRILEGAAILFRLALFGQVFVKCFPPHPCEIPISMLDCSKTYLQQGNDLKVNRSADASPYITEENDVPLYSFSDFDSCYDFLYTHWFKNIIHSRLAPTQDYRRIRPPAVTPVAYPPVSQQEDAVPQQVFLNNTALRSATVNSTPAPQSIAKKRPWYESRRVEVAATANRLRKEIEAIVLQRNASGRPIKGNERIHVRRVTENVDPNHISLSCSERPSSIIEVDILDPSVLPMANSAKMEFLSLVQGVVTMLIERHRCWDSDMTAANASAGKTQFLSVPANMIVLAAIKVTLTFISPHFDRLAPHLVHWISVRCCLILWIWRECRSEVTRRAEERWDELWMKHHPDGPPPQRLKIRFTSMQCADGHYVELTPAKLAKAVLGVLPCVLQSMISFYEKRENLPDDTVTREFFSKWLKSSGDNDLVTHVNTLLTQPPSLEKPDPLHKDKSASTGVMLESSTSSHTFGPTEVSPSTLPEEYWLSKSGTSHDNTPSTPSDPTYTFPYTNYPGPNPSGGGGGGGGVVASSRPSTTTNALGAPSFNTTVCTASDQNQNVPYLPQVPPLPHREQSLNKKTRKGSTAMASRHVVNNEGVDDFLDWLYNLTYSERLRLDGHEIPKWQLPKMSHVSPPDLLLWKCPELVHPFSGNGLKGAAFDRHESQRYYRPESQNTTAEDTNDGSTPYVFPLSDLDWKVTTGVLKLLKSRGVDALVSRNRGKVFFLDHYQNYSKTLEQQLNLPLDKFPDTDKRNGCEFHEPLNDDEHKKRGLALNGTSSKKRKTRTAATVGVQKRYGWGFSKSNDLYSISSHDLFNDHISDLHTIRSFLETGV